MIRGLILLLLLGVAVASLPEQYCETPGNFEADVMQRYQGYRNGTNEGWGLFGKYFQDAENYKVAQIDDVDERSGDTHFWTITHYASSEHGRSDSIEFVIDLDTKECTYRKIDEEFRPVMLPDNVEFYKAFYVGSSGFKEGSVLTNNFYAKAEDQEAKVEYSAFYTDYESGCFPVEESIKEKDEDGYEFMTHINYFNCVKGITDPTVFDPPSDCKEEQY